jgi:hypothetical protein
MEIAVHDFYRHRRIPKNYGPFYCASVRVFSTSLIPISGL